MNYNYEYRPGRLRQPLALLSAALIVAMVIAACVPTMAPLSEPADEATPISSTPDINIETSSMSTFARMSETIDFPLYDDTATEVGQIQDYMIDISAGLVPYIVVSFEDFGDDLFPIPADYVRIDPEGASLRTTVERELLDAAPRLEPETAPIAGYQPAWDSDLRVYWQNFGIVPDDVPRTDLPQPVMVPYYRYGLGIRTLPGTVTRFTDFLHHAVVTPQDITLGQIEDVVFDRLTYEVPYLAVLWDPATVADELLDGNMGLVPLGGLTWIAQEERLIHDLDRQALIDAPRFGPSAWPDMGSADWHAELQNYWTDVDPAVALRAGTRILPDAIMRLDNVLGRDVTSLNGDDLGTLEDLIVGTDDGRVAYAVLDLSGFFALEDTYHLVPANSLTLNTVTDSAILGVDRMTLEESPTLASSMLGEIAQLGWNDEFDAYWQEWVMTPTDALVEETDVDTADAAPRSAVPAYVAAGTLDGYRVENSDGDELGHIEELVLNLTKGTVEYGVLSFGGFAGLGDKLFAVPMNLLTPDIDLTNELVIFNVEPIELEITSGFDTDDWPEIGNPIWRHEVSEYWENQF